MQNLNEITMGMKPHEKEIYFAALHRNAIWEQQKIEVEREQNRKYKQSLIKDILDWTGDKWTLEELQKKDIRTLERIFDNC